MHSLTLLFPLMLKLHLILFLSPRCLLPEILSTVGVDLGIWRYRKDLEPDLRGKKKSGKTMKSVTFFTWDFGGQEEYYVTHQCFLSTRSLYLVVWDVEEGEEGIEQLGPWLHNIQVMSHPPMGWTICGLST